MKSEPIKGLLSLLRVTEKLLFSFPLSPDIVQKYESMKQEVYSKLGIEYSHSKIWRMQREAHSKQSNSSIDKGVQVSSEHPSQEQLYSLRLQEMEENANMLRWELLERIDASHALNSQYQNMCNHLGSSYTSFASRVSLIVGLKPEQFHPKNPAEYSRLEKTYGKPLNIFELESLNEVSVNKFKTLEHIEQELLDEFEHEFKLIDSNLRHGLALLEETVSSQQKSIEHLNYKLSEAYELNIHDKSEMEMLLNETRDKITGEAENMRQQLTMKNQEIVKMTEQQLREAHVKHQREIGSLEDNKRRLEIEIDNLRHELASERHISTMNKTSMTEEINNFAVEIKKLNEIVNANKEEIAARQNAESKLQLELCQVKEENDNTHEELKKTINALENQELKHKQTVAELKLLYSTQINHLEKSMTSDSEHKVNNFQQQLEISKQQNKNLEKIMNSKILEYQDTIKELERALERERGARRIESASLPPKPHNTTQSEGMPNLSYEYQRINQILQEKMNKF